MLLTPKLLLFLPKRNGYTDRTSTGTLGFQPARLGSCSIVNVLIATWPMSKV